MKTIEITNFSGRLTRITNGDLNSGFSKFTSSFGYDPFSKPMNLTWLEDVTDITGPINGLITGAKPRPEGTDMIVYAIDNNGKLYRINSSSTGNANVDSVVGISSVSGGGDAYNYGASMDIFRNLLYAGGDARIHIADLSTLAEQPLIGSAANFLANSFKPLRQFVGKLWFGNGNTVALIDSTGTITSSVIGTGVQNLYSALNPPLPSETRVADVDVSVNYDYLLITASGVSNENLTSLGGDRQAGQGSDGVVFKFNGVDPTVTAATQIPSYAVTALQTYLGNNTFFADDSFGSSVNDGVNKILSLPNNKSPFANGTTTNGNFLTWICPEVSSDGTQIKASMYYFGALDRENPVGLYRVLRYSTSLTNGFIYQAPVNVLTNNRYRGINNSRTSVMNVGYGKHYLSTYEVNANTTQSKLLRFLITPTGTGTPQAGVYETQNQLFSKRISVSEIRVYTEPTVAGNGFQVDIIGGDGAVVDNGTFTYNYVAGTVITSLQGPLERINFSPAIKTLFSCGIRITNTGTTNMTIKKIEVDVVEEGK